MSEQPRKSWLNLTRNPLLVFAIALMIVIAILIGITNNGGRVAEWQFLLVLSLIMLLLSFEAGWGRIKAVLNHKVGRVIFVGTIMVSAGVWLHYSPWTGFRGQFIPPFTEPARDLWDWLQLLGVLAVPIAVAVIGYQLRKLELKRAEDNLREQRLQTYLDRMGELLTVHHLAQSPPNEIVGLAATHTHIGIRNVVHDNERLYIVLMDFRKSNQMK